MTPRCPGKCGRVLHADQRICTSCRSKLTSAQRTRIDAGVDVTEVISNITSAASSWSTSSTCNSSSSSGGYDSGSSGGGDCGSF